MNIEYVGRSYVVGQRVRQHAEKKLAKVLKFLEEPVEVRFTLEHEKLVSTAELHIHHRHGILQATESAEVMLDAVSLAVEKVETQASRNRKRFMDRRRRADRELTNGHHWPVDVVTRESVAEGASEGPRVIKTTKLEIKPMTVEEAALRLEGGKNQFVVFRDAGNDKIAVLYKRKDDHYGLIATEF